MSSWVSSSWNSVKQNSYKSVWRQGFIDSRAIYFNFFLVEKRTFLYLFIYTNLWEVFLRHTNRIIWKGLTQPQVRPRRVGYITSLKYGKNLEFAHLWYYSFIIYKCILNIWKIELYWESRRSCIIKSDYAS